MLGNIQGAAVALLVASILCVSPLWCEQKDAAASSKIITLGNLGRKSVACLIGEKHKNALLLNGKGIRLRRLNLMVNGRLKRFSSRSMLAKSSRQSLMLLKKRIRRCAKNKAPYTFEGSNSSSSEGSFSSFFSAGSNASFSSAGSNASVAPVCGDNIMDAGEVCECGADFICGTNDDFVGEQSCASFGFLSGVLRCRSSCLRFDTSGCVFSPDGPALYVDNDGGDGLQSGCSDTFSREENSLLTPFCTIRRAANLSVPGDTIYVRGGTYTRSDAPNYGGTVEITISGTASQPIAYRNYPAEVPVIDAQSRQVYALRLGDPVLMHERTVENIIVAGFEITGAVGPGVYLHKPDSVSIRGCSIHANNRSADLGNSAYAAGIMGMGGGYTTIEDCRIFDNGYGIIFFELAQLNYDEIGSDHIIIRRNLIYGNSRSGNYGNSAGIALRFGTNAVIEHNVLWDNPDGGIVGLGALNWRVVGNALLSNWQEGGNMEGIKLSVRGGALNLIAFNISAFNGSRGIDLADGVGEIVLNNVFYKNDRWGALLEGTRSMLFNNIAYGNYATSAAWDKDYRGGGIGTMKGLNVLSDYNMVGSAPLFPKMTVAGDIEPHAIHGNPLFTEPDLPLSRANPRQIVPPEDLFRDYDSDGVVTAAEALQDLAERFGLQEKSEAKGNGTSLSNASQIILGDLATVRNALNEKINEWDTPTAPIQHKEGVWVYRHALEYLDKPGLNGYGNLNGLQDLFGHEVASDIPINMGAVR